MANTGVDVNRDDINVIDTMNGQIDIRRGELLPVLRLHRQLGRQLVAEIRNNASTLLKLN